MTDSVLPMIIAVLSQRYPHAKFDDSTNIFDAGLADSLAFSEIILDIEAHTTLSFHHEAIDFDGPMTPAKMAHALRAV
jgi:acyl carrier protein